MLTNPVSYIGVDPAGGHSPFVYAVVNDVGRLERLGDGDINDVIGIISRTNGLFVAVNAPPRPNVGLVKKRIQEYLREGQGHIRGSDVRVAEQELKKIGVVLPSTPGRKELCPAWMQGAFALYDQMNELGFEPYPASSQKRQWLETNPHATFSTLLGHLPLSKPTLEGRLQRQLVLYSAGLGIKDPMVFFEEITKHKLMGGNLPIELVYQADELDALSAALVAFRAGKQHEDITSIGDENEGVVYLPIRQLKLSYA